MHKKFKFDCTNKWYMYNPEPIQENETSLGFWDTSRLSNLSETINFCDCQSHKKKENLPNCGLCHPGRSQRKNKRMQKER